MNEALNGVPRFRGASDSQTSRHSDAADCRPWQDSRRDAAAPNVSVIVPAVAHWKVGHYAAIVARGNGGYFVEDTTFGEDIRVSPATLDEEASGYFLVPAGSLPTGWRHVSAQEGATVWGRGSTGNSHDSGATGNACTGSGCTAADVELEVVGLQLHDTPVGYAPPVGPAVRFNLVYSHRDTQQPATFSYTNFGPKWTFTWLSYITDTVNSSNSALLYRRGGGNEPYTFSSTSATTAYPGPYSQATMTRTVNGSGNSTGFTLTYPDGSFEQFDQAVGNQFFMTAVSDPAGNIVTLTYDSQMRITAITDAIGQVSTISYGLAGSPLVVTQITDPFGRSASFTYSVNGQLASITDVLGITSSYTYGPGSDPDFINTWLHSSDLTNTSRFKESEKQPLENRVWYNYPGQGTGGVDSDAYYDPNTHLISVGPNFHPYVSTQCGPEQASTAIMLGHEIGHAATGASDNGPDSMSNVNLNENPIRLELGLPLRTAYPLAIPFTF